MRLDLRRIKARTIPYAFRAWPRIFLAAHARTPLGAGFGSSRFSSPDQSFRVLYAASDFATALAEAVIRDRFEGKQRRFLYRAYLDARVVTTIATTTDLHLLDLTGSGAYEIGIDTDAKHAKAHHTGQNLSQVLHERTELDGILYDSRLTGKLCVAIYDRAFSCLTATDPMRLTRVEALRPELERLGVTVRRERGPA